MDSSVEVQIAVTGVILGFVNLKVQPYSSPKSTEKKDISA